MRKQTKLAVVLAAAALLAVSAASVVSAAGWVQEGSNWRYQEASGDYAADTMKKSGDTTFYLDENGYMAKDYFCQYNENYYYFGSNGAMVKNTWVAIDPSLVDAGDDDVDAYWYYFQDTGKAYKAGDGAGCKKKAIDGKTYLFNEDGQMLTGWVDNSGEKKNPDEDNAWLTDGIYYAGTDGVLRQGWLAWSDGLQEDYTLGNSDMTDRATIYFYFGTNFKKLGVDAGEEGKEKTINGKKYRFAKDTGVMYTGWEYLEELDSRDGGKAQYARGNSDWDVYTKYYSGEDDGHMVKKGWVYAVPSELIHSEKNNDEEEAYFYFNNSGILVYNQMKKINGKYYAFDKAGIMKTGLILFDGSDFYKKVDLDYTESSDFIKKSDCIEEKKEDNWNIGQKLHTSGTDYTVHYFGSDGAEQTGTKVAVEFADGTAYFGGKHSGGGYVGENKKKYYSNGFLCKANDDIKLGLYMINDNDARNGYTSAQINAGWVKSTDTTKFPCYVLTTSGSKKKKGAFKDGDGNYWLVNGDNYFCGCYDVQVKYKSDEETSGKFQWKANLKKNDTNKDGTILTEAKEDQFIWSDQKCKGGSEGIEDHYVTLNDDYCTNFYITK